MITELPELTAVTKPEVSTDADALLVLQTPPKLSFVNFTEEPVHKDVSVILLLSTFGKA